MVEHKPAAASRRPARQPTTLQIVPGSLRARPELLRSTALQAVFLAAITIPTGQPVAQTMPTPTALPTGGQVIAGQAKITATTTPTTASMTVGQTTTFGAYNWNTFDIGAKASVKIDQPTAKSISVHRVVTPSPSKIAGKLSSNGAVVISNQSGVVFTQGAEVNVSTLVASAPGISEANARAGKLVFDQPAQAGAKVENHGTITVAQTGLAALVAPEVANSGVIRAQMGRVVLAGAETHTVDLFGDGLLSIDVTRQVTKAPAGGTALVTNSGTVIADGGTILLTASAVDGLVQTLVTSGGTLRANSVATPTGNAGGRIAVTAKGGNVAVTGSIVARGEVAGSKGGQIEINAPARSVTLRSGAVVDASGRAGGGSIVVGTTVARAKGGTALVAPTARDVVIESGARVAADATQSGRGGDITVLSDGGRTEHRGELFARGGPEGGDGGFIEVSGSRFSIGGSVVDVTAPAGASGSILLDPDDLVISSSPTSADANAPTKNADSIVTKATGGAAFTNLDVADILGLSGNITIEAKATLVVNAAVDVTSKAGIGDVTLLSGGAMTINAAVTGANNITLKNTTGNLILAAPVSTTGAGKTIALNSVAGSIAMSTGTASLVGSVSAGARGTIDLIAGAGGVVQSAGSLVAKTLLSSGGIAGDAKLTSATNNLGGLGAITVAGGNFALVNSAALTITGALLLDAGKAASFAAPGFTITTGSVASAGGTFELAPISGPISLGAATASELVLTQATLDKVAVGTIQLGSTSADGATASSISLNDALDTSAATTVRLIAGTGGMALTKGKLTAGTLDLATTGGGVTDAGADVVATRLQSTGGISGSVALDKGAHEIAAIGDLTVTAGDLTVTSAKVIAVTGTVSADNISLTSSAASNSAIGISGSLTAGGATGNVTLVAKDVIGGISLSGAVLASKGSIDLSAGTGGVAQTGGAVTTGVLTATGPVGGTIKLTQAANAIGSIANLALTAGDLLVTSATTSAVTGAVSADNISLTSNAASKGAIDVSGTAIAVNGSLTTSAGGTAVLVASAAKAGIALVGSVDVSSTGTLSINAGADGVIQPGGSIVAGSLVSAAGIQGA